ncbi:MAG TPA: penicillin-binding transpeptidase domain-containing protein [Candidatus Binatia bacterium]|nr:penicillin-binding transpeptidase domain-containing protein [Candidatus Binatia bacterium]
MKRVARPQTRMGVVAGVFAGLFALLVVRAVDLAVLRGPALARLAAMQHRQRIELMPHRGPIVDRNGESLALSVDVPSVYLRPREFRGQEARIPALAAALHVPARAVRAKIDRGQPFVWLARHVLPREAEAVERLALRGVYTVAEARRFYPHGSLAAHVLGFVGVDSQGLEGIESRLDRVIRGEPQYLHVDRDARGREISTNGVQAPPAQGERVELTIDAAIQDATEKELAAGVAAAKAVAGAAVVLDPRTGEVLALANYPTYNPNEAADPRTVARDPQWHARVRNRAISDFYEPGSTFKAILAAAAIEEKIVTPSEMFNCENGRFQVGKWTIHDSHPHGWLSFAEVIQYSSNIGAAKVGERLGRERYYRYLRSFGFGEKTGIELRGETPGLLHPAETWARIDLATHSFGQGVSVTPIQMAAAFAAIANGGQLMRPYLVRRIVAPTGEVTLENEPVLVRRVVSPRTAAIVTELLRRVVEEKGGTGSKARVEDFPVAGKTGTAQKVNAHTGGYSSKRIGSFVGFVPADDPRLVILVMIDEPTTSSYGGIVAAPVFRGIAVAGLKHLGVEPATPAVQLVDAVPPAERRAPAPAAAAPASAEPLPDPNGTPSFLGLSLREALLRAQTSGWDVEVTGTGYVAQQVPPPGTPLAADRRLALRLAPGDGTVAP